MKAAKRRYSMTARAAKAHATRERICAAAVELYAGRPMQDFTLEDVARLAETTVQTILRAFGSKEDLLIAALTVLAQSGDFAQAPPGDVAAAVRAIFDIYETIGDLVIARLGDERRLPALKPVLEEGRAGHRTWVEKTFAPEIAGRANVLELLCIATDVYVWKILRRDRCLERAAAEEQVISLVSAIVKENAHG